MSFKHNTYRHFLICIIDFVDTARNDVGPFLDELGKALKSNTTLTELDLCCVYKRRHTNGIHQQIIFVSFLFIHAANSIENTGAISLSEALKSNTTLAILDLRCKDKRKKRHTNGTHQQMSLHFISTSTGNKIGDTGATSLSESLKSNTTLTKLYIGSENKREKTRQWHPSTIHSSFFSPLSTDNWIGRAGSQSLIEALKINKTLKFIGFDGECKRRRTKDIHKQITFFFFSLLINSQLY